MSLEHIVNIRKKYAECHDFDVPDVTGNPLTKYIEWLENGYFIRGKMIERLQKGEAELPASDNLDKR